MRRSILGAAVTTVLAIVGSGVGVTEATRAGGPTCAAGTAWQSALELKVTLAPPAGATAGFGHRLRAVAAPRNGSKVIVLGVPTRSQQLWVYVLDPTTLAQVQPAQRVDLPNPPGNTFFPQYGSAVADFDGNGVPDFASGNTNPGTVYVVFGDVDGSGNLVYNNTQRVMISGAAIAGANASSFGVGLGASAVVDGAAHPLFVAEAGVLSKGGKISTPGKIYAFRWSGTTPLSPSMTVTDVIAPTITDTLGAFGFSAGDINGDFNDDVIAGAPKRDIGSAADAGAVFVFEAAGPGIFNDVPSFTITAAAPVAGGNFGDRTLFAGDIDLTGSRDIVATASLKGDAVYAPLGSGIPNGTGLFSPAAGQNSQFAYHSLDSADVNGDGRGDAIIPASTASAGGNCAFGIAWTWLSNASGSWDRISLQPPVGQANGRFGSGSALLPDPNDPVANRGLVIVGDDSVTANGVAGAGQVYIYRVK